MNQINLNEGINILKKNQKELEAKIEFCEKNEKEYFPTKDVKKNLFRTIIKKLKNKKESKLVEDFDDFKDEINGKDLQIQPLTSNQRTEVTKTPILL